MTKQVGWIDIEEESGFRILYRAHLMVEDSDPEKWGPVNHNFSEIIEWFDKRFMTCVEVKLVGRAYRVFVEEPCEAELQTAVRDLLETGAGNI